MKRFCDENFPDEKFRNDSTRKQFLLKRGFKLQKDDTGIEGVAVPKEGHGDGNDEKEIKIGKRLSASKVRVEDWGEGGADTRDQREASRNKMLGAIKVQANSQARVLVVCQTCARLRLPKPWGKPPPAKKTRRMTMPSPAEAPATSAWIRPRPLDVVKVAKVLMVGMAVQVRQ